MQGLRSEAIGDIAVEVGMEEAELVRRDKEAPGCVRSLVGDKGRARTGAIGVERKDIELVGEVDQLKLYLREIARERLLTAEEERLLAHRIREGQAVHNRLDDEHLTPDCRQELLRKVVAGNKARARLIQANLRLVVSVAKGYRTESTLEGVDPFVKTRKRPILS